MHVAFPSVSCIFESPVLPFSPESLSLWKRHSSSQFTLTNIEENKASKLLGTVATSSEQQISLMLR